MLVKVLFRNQLKNILGHASTIVTKSIQGHASKIMMNLSDAAQRPLATIEASVILFINQLKNILGHASKIVTKSIQGHAPKIVTISILRPCI
jgi:hypothetical protein